MLLKQYSYLNVLQKKFLNGTSEVPGDYMTGDGLLFFIHVDVWLFLYKDTNLNHKERVLMKC